jgi:uncharacterized protein YceK
MKTLKMLILVILVASMLAGCASLGIKTVETSSPTTAATTTPVVLPTATKEWVCPSTIAEAIVIAQNMSKDDLSAMTEYCNSTQAVPEILSPTATTVPTATLATGQADVRAQVDSFKTGNWNVTTFQGITDQITGWGKNLKDPVKDWSKFPNVDFPKYSFKATDGVEYGMAESAYCQQDQTCDINVPAMHYRLITGDYDINGVDECKKISETDPGCGIILVNVGNVTAMFRNQSVDYGFTVEGRYWNGNAMPTTIWALSSNTVYNMLNVEGDVNMGANCSVSGGCTSVRLTTVIMSGNQILLKATTIVTR